MENDEITALKCENPLNHYIYKGENLKKEKSLKSNYSNSSSVETQFDNTTDNQQKSDTIPINKDNESANEVTTLINYNLNKKSDKMENMTDKNSSTLSVINDSNENNHNQFNDTIKNVTSSSSKQLLSKDYIISSATNINEMSEDNKVNGEIKNKSSFTSNKDSDNQNLDQEADDKENSIESISSVVYSYSLNTKKLTPKLNPATSPHPKYSQELTLPIVTSIDTASSLISNSLESTPMTATPKTPRTPKTPKTPAGKMNNIDIENPTSYYSPTMESKTFDANIENNGLTRSESSPSIFKSDTKSNKNVNSPPVKSNSQPPIPSTTFSNFKNKSLLNRIRRKEVIKELIESERLYVSDLQMLIENCFNPLEAVSWLPLNEKCLLIRNIQELFAFQQDFLKDIEEAVKELKEKMDDNSNDKNLSEEEMDKIMNKCVKDISDCFIYRKKKFKVYSEFCSLHQEAINIFRDYERKPEMISFIRDFNGKTQSRLHLQDFLIKPVQRICKYPLLLKEIIHYSDKNCEELEGLNEALTVMSEVAREIDHVKWLIERVQRTDKFIDRLDIQDPFKYIIMERYGDMILSTGLEVVMEKERVNYRGVFLFRKHMFIVKPKRSKNYRVKMHLILDEFYFQAYPEYNAFRLIQKGTGIIIDFFAFSTVESKIWIELMETLVESLEEIADKNKIFYIKAKNSYESHFSRFSLELKSLSSGNVYSKNNNLRRTASSSLVNSHLEPLRPIDVSSKPSKRESVVSSINKRDSVESVDYYRNKLSSKTSSNQDAESASTEFITFNATPKFNPITTSTSLKSKSLTDTTKSDNNDYPQKRSSEQSTGSTYPKKASLQVPSSSSSSNIKKQNLHSTSSVNSIKAKYYHSNTGSTTGLSTADTEVSSNGSDILYFDTPVPGMDHELIVSESGVPVSDSNSYSTRLVSEPESFKSVPKKFDMLSDTISKTDSLSSTMILPPKYKLIDSKFYDVYTYLFTNNDIQKIFSNLMYRTHEFDHLLYHKKTTRSRSNSCPRERYIFKSSKDRKEKEKFNANCCMTAMEDRASCKGSIKSDNRSSQYMPVLNNDNRSIKSSRSSVNLYHLNEETFTPPPPNIFKHTKNNGSFSCIRKPSCTTPSLYSNILTDDSSIHSTNSLKYRKRHSISIFKSNSTSQAFDPTRSLFADNQLMGVDSPSSRCYSSLSDKMIDQDINFYFETMQSAESPTNIADQGSIPSLDTLSLHDPTTTNNNNNNNKINNNNNKKSPYSYRKTIAIMDTNTLNALHKLCNDDDDDPNLLNMTSSEEPLDSASVNEEYNNNNININNNNNYNDNNNNNNINNINNNNTNNRKSYYQNRNSVTVDSNNKFETNTIPRSYGKIKGKKEKKVLFGNIKKIFSGSSRHSSSSSSSSSLSSNPYLKKEHRNSNYSMPKYSSESNLSLRTSHNLKSPSLQGNLCKYSNSDYEISSLSSPLQRSKSPLSENVNNISPTSQESFENSHKSPSNTNLNKSSLYENEDDEYQEFNSLEHLGDHEPLEPEPEPIIEMKPESKLKMKLKIKQKSKREQEKETTSKGYLKESVPIHEIKINTALPVLIEEPKSSNSSKPSTPRLNTSIVYKNNSHLNSATSPSYYHNSPLSANTNDAFNNKSLLMNESYVSNTSVISNKSLIQNRSFNSVKSNASIKSNKTAHSQSSSVVKKFYLDQKDIVIPYPGKKKSLNSMSSNESLKENSIHSQSNSIVLENNNSQNEYSHDTLTDNSLSNHSTKPLPHLNIVEEVGINTDGSDDDDDNHNIRTPLDEERNNFKENRIASSNGSISPSTNHYLIHSSSNSTLSSVQSTNSSRNQKKNKTIALKLINLKKIF
ncbi:hypothetical protein BCR32DRAFT_162897 [Anaeromyces robustus]|uniref:DH domain-containing protein n=1 Tax=Anaeromyces robustus TaxID=1754192 RepID=A0A1Y1X9Y4_9FUNG|nr:hypothetical protein BCR32DRAFT_162897 [Anaeromyces robustus]|eukprot:ORX82555.1 hypothetical protein BCR32DRAFT_162897 [Anaeromyces robustus]